MHTLRHTHYRVYGYRWIVLIIYMYVQALVQLYWLNFAAITTYIEERFRISAADVMWLTLVFALIQVPLTLPAGILIDKKGFKFGFCLGAVLTGIFPLLRLLDPTSYPILLISQIGISIAQPFVINGVTKLAITWFPPKEEATAVGLSTLAMYAGMLIALGATPWLVEKLSFETMLLIYGIMGLAGALATIFFVRSGPPTPAREVSIRGEIPSWNGLKEILRIKDFIILGFIAFVGIGVFCALASWIEKILYDLHGISMIDAGNISAALMLGSMVGCIIAPVISDKTGKRKPVLILAIALSIVCMLVLLFTKGYYENIANSIALGFFMISTRPIIYTMSAEMVGPKFAGLSIGYLMLMASIATAVITQVMDSIRTMTGDFVGSLLLLVILLTVSLVLSLLINDTHPQE